MFEKIMGKRLAMELLLADKKLTAQESVDCGFTNAIIPDLKNEPDWFDISKVPTIGKLLVSD
jgi:enoyl-CoA hydratase/carnithine racemase